MNAHDAALAAGHDAPAAGHDDRAGDDHRHAADVAGPGRGRRAERPARPGRDRRAADGDVRDAVLRAGRCTACCAASRRRRRWSPSSASPTTRITTCTADGAGDSRRGRGDPRSRHARCNSKACPCNGERDRAVSTPSRSNGKPRPTRRALRRARRTTTSTMPVDLPEVSRGRRRSSSRVPCSCSSAACSSSACCPTASRREARQAGRRERAATKPIVDVIKPKPSNRDRSTSSSPADVRANQIDRDLRAHQRLPQDRRRASTSARG